MRLGAATLAAVASLLVIVGACIAVAARQERHQLGSNWVRPVMISASEVPAGKRVCQPGMRLPEGTGGLGLRLYPNRPAGLALDVTITAPGAPAVRGRLAPGWTAGDVVVPIPELGAERRGARVCVEHAGPGRLGFAGGPGFAPDARVGAREIDGTIRIEYVEPEPEAWWTAVPAMVDRLAVARDALPGPASLPLFALLACAVIGGALALVVTEGRR